ncbi:MAG: ABC transporter permease [Candidatus Omnitrophica bacterium]|nr:ABC transporter permease [Candidatus Omnitrophota bacterium]
MDRTIVTYEPDNSLKKGYLSIFREIYNEFKKNRWLTLQLFKRDLFTIYKQSFIGIFWAFIIPLVSVLTFIILNRAGVFNIGNINVPYPIFAILGIAFWQLFSTGLIAGSNAIVKAGSMIIKINFSKKSLVLAAMGQSVVAFFIQIVLVTILFVAYRITPAKESILFSLALIPLILFTLGLSFILALLNGIMRDIANVLSVLMTFLLFLTPVLYARSETGLLAKITDYNPIYFLVSAPRDLILRGSICEWNGFLLSAVFSCAIFIVSLIIFHLTETRIAERI